MIGQSRRIQSEAVAAANKAVDLPVVQYREGRVDFNRVAVLQQNLVNEQNLLAQANGQIAAGLVNVYRALGGGWQIRLEEDCPVEESTGTANMQNEASPPSPIQPVRPVFEVS